VFKLLRNWRTWIWLTVAFGFGMGTMQICRNRIPLVDYGHRCFAVQNQPTAELLLTILHRFGLQENFTFSPGKTNQTILNDGTTALIWFDESVKPEERQNGFSVVTDQPVEDALWAMVQLEAKGFSCRMRDDLFPPELRGKIVILESDAFLGWVMVFRRHSFQMGERPQLRTITRH
jgi:hypothetical protein